MHHQPPFRLPNLSSPLIGNTPPWVLIIKLKHADKCNFTIHSTSQIKGKLASESFPTTNVRLTKQNSPRQHQEPKKFSINLITLNQIKIGAA